MTVPPCPPRPGTPWQSRVTRIAAVRAEAPGVRTYDLVFRDGPGDYRFLPGQFNMLLLPGIGEAAISISSDSLAAAGRGVGHTVRAVGNVTEALARLDVGAEVILRGPFGKPWPLDDLRGRDLVVVAGGVGLASLRSAILHIAAHRGRYGRVAVLHGAKTPADLLCTADYAAWRREGIEVVTTVDAPDPGWTGRVGFVPVAFDALPIAPEATSVLCCGPERMMDAVVDRALSRGVGPADILLSLERNMACAAGFCGLCQFGPAFICKDGPVFRYDAIAAYLAVPHL
jgi:NAD(P)H-flavin reductase